MNINTSRSITNVSSYTTEAGETSLVKTPTRVQEIKFALGKLARKYPNLDKTLAEALATQKEIANSDTWEGLKWYEVPVAPLAMKANKMMKAEHAQTVSKLQYLVAARNDLQAELACYYS